MADDITERKRKETALRDSEAKSAAAFHASPDLMAVTRLADGIILEVNDGYSRMLGYSREESIGKTTAELAIWADSGDRKKFADALQSFGHIMDFETRLRRKDGSVITVIDSAQTMTLGDDVCILSVAHDITARERAEEALQESKDFLDKIINSIADPIFVKDRQHRFVLVNDALCAMTGHNREEYIGKTDYDFFPKEQVEVFQQKDEIVFERGKENVNEEAITDSQGVIRTIVTKKTLYQDASSNKFIVGIIRDITDQKRSEKELFESERRLTNIIDFLPDAIVVINKEGKVIAWNCAIEKMTGIKAEEMLGRGNYEHAIPFYGERRPILVDLVLEPQEEIEKSYSNIKREGSYLVGEAYMPMLGGGKTYLWGVASALCDAQGNIVGAIESIKDITDRRHAEEELKRAHSRMRIAMDLVKLVQWEYDVETDMFNFDDQFYALYGTTAKREGGPLMSSQDYAQKFIPPEEASLVAEEIGKSLATTDPNFTSQVEHRIIRADGTERIIVVRFGIIKDDKGRTIKTYGANQDITERKRAEEALRKAHDELEMQVKERTEELARKNTEMERFIYTVSHDLRTPLISVSGFLGFIEQDAQKGDLDRLKNDIRIANEAVTKMDRLLMETLELSRIGRVINPPEDVSFDQIVQDALGQIRSKIESKGFKISVDQNLPVVHVDRMRIAEVLVNLIENSTKYIGLQANPEIEIGQRIDGKDRIFFVRDNGIGIDPRQHDNVFELFYKVDKKSEGTGAGLAIVKRIIEVHGGRIWIESELGKGCTVCFTLPLADYQ